MLTLLFILALPSIITLVTVILSYFLGELPEEKRQWWRLQVLVAYDQLINALFQGWADESMSSRSYRKRIEENDGFWEKVINSIFFWEKDHCYLSYLSEKERLQLPPALRK